MLRFTLVGFLWFAAAWVGYEIVWSVTGAPRLIGPALAFGIAAFAVARSYQDGETAEPVVLPSTDPRNLLDA
jgi:hypothetical protein